MTDIETWHTTATPQEWPDSVRLNEATADLRGRPPLVFAGECDHLRDRLAQVARGEAFVLQSGDCTETFSSVTADAIRDKLRTLLQMSAVLTYAASVPVVKLSRIAGRYGGAPSARRDALARAAREIAPGGAPAPGDRDPWRMVRRYQSSAATLNLVRAFTTGGYADLHQVHAWNREFVTASPVGERYEPLTGQMDRALNFMRTCGTAPEELGTVEISAAHEALLLDYEAALTRTDSRTGLRYNTSGHLVWLGEQFRALDGPHLGYLATIRNPLGVELGPGAGPDEILACLDRLDPDREPGRLTFLVRMGADATRDRLPALIEKVRAEGHPVAWLCDPMHGTTFESSGGHHTRPFTDVLDEVTAFFDVHRSLGTHPGGIHVELTGHEATGRGSTASRRAAAGASGAPDGLGPLDLAFHVAGMFPAGT